MWQAVQTGHVTHADALACGEGLRYGFTCGVDITKLQGYLTFENYQSAIGAGEAVIKGGAQAANCHACMVVIEDVFHLFSGWLNAAAFLNMLLNVVAADRSQLLMSGLHVALFLNSVLMSVMSCVSTLPRLVMS